MNVIGCIILMYGLTTLAALLSVGLLLVVFWIKAKRFHMDAKKWDAYFQALSNREYLLRFSIMYAIPLLLLSIVAYYMFAYFKYEHCALLALLTFAFGAGNAGKEILFHKQVILDKLKRLRTTSTSLPQ